MSGCWLKPVILIESFTNNLLRKEMARITNPFKGVNKVCAQCIKDCKQFKNVVLVNCPNLTPRPHKKG